MDTKGLGHTQTEWRFIAHKTYDLTHWILGSAIEEKDYIKNNVRYLRTVPKTGSQMLWVHKPIQFPKKDYRADIHCQDFICQLKTQVLKITYQQISVLKTTQKWNLQSLWRKDSWPSYIHSHRQTCMRAHACTCTHTHVLIFLISPQTYENWIPGQH